MTRFYRYYSQMKMTRFSLERQSDPEKMSIFVEQI